MSDADRQPLPACTETLSTTLMEKKGKRPLPACTETVSATPMVKKAKASVLWPGEKKEGSGPVSASPGIQSPEKQVDPGVSGSGPNELCAARTWSSGQGLRCMRPGLCGPTEDLCKLHALEAARNGGVPNHGRFDGPIPEGKPCCNRVCYFPVLGRLKHHLFVEFLLLFALFTTGK
ncbi:unnamed protein product [Polarella glacialis]|uniref:Uncharacterized protein n=1 Tax=Polarella glacialis TaxID=89957 RepID=A0A813EB40_POLGL|nr:unnamed protein product [Polarella glacialis]